MSAQNKFSARRGGGLVRTIYVDEAGTSKNEPAAVVVAILVHGDTQYRPALNHLRHLRDVYVPEQIRADFVFHATDIWHSAKPFGGDEKSHPFARRVQIIKRLASIPRKHGLSVAYGFVRNVPGISEDAEFRHLTSFVICLQQIAKLVAERFPNEMASLVIEDHPTAKPKIRAIHRTLRGDKPEESMVKDLMEELHFAAKDESPLLQVADAVAFSLRRCIANFNLGAELANAVAMNASQRVFRGGDYGAGFATAMQGDDMLPLTFSFSQPSF